MSFEQPAQKETEVRPEKKSRLWETLRIVGLTGILAFNGMKVVEQMRSGTAGREQTKITEYDDTEKQKAAEEYQEFLNDKTAIVRGDYKLPRIEDGRIINETTLTTRDGKVYETKAEIDIATSQFANEDPKTLREEIKHWKPGSEMPAWNRNIISSTAEDGSGFKVDYEVTTEGLKMTVQELGEGGKVMSERTHLLQEVEK